MTIYLYKISFTGRPKVYIGQTIDPKRRWAEHKAAYKKNSTYAVHRAIRKYGIKATNFEIIATCLEHTQECGDQAEIAMIEQYDSFHNGYNMTFGGNNYWGENHPCFGKTHSVEQRQKNSIANSGSKHPGWGKKQSQETVSKRVSQMSYWWRLTFKDNIIEEIFNLKPFCKERGYDSSRIYDLANHKCKFHKDIIKAEKIKKSL